MPRGLAQRLRPWLDEPFPLFTVEPPEFVRILKSFLHLLRKLKELLTHVLSIVSKSRLPVLTGLGLGRHRLPCSERKLEKAEHVILRRQQSLGQIFGNLLAL